MNNPNSKERAREIFKRFSQMAFSGSERAYDVEKFNKCMNEAFKETAQALDAVAEEAAGIAESFADKPSVNKSLVIAQAIRAHFNLIKQGSIKPATPLLPKGEGE